MNDHFKKRGHSIMRRGHYRITYDAVNDMDIVKIVAPKDNTGGKCYYVIKNLCNYLM